MMGTTGNWSRIRDLSKKDMIQKGFTSDPFRFAFVMSLPPNGTSAACSRTKSMTFLPMRSRKHGPAMTIQQYKKLKGLKKKILVII